MHVVPNVDLDRDAHPAPSHRTPERSRHPASQPVAQADAATCTAVGVGTSFDPTARSRQQGLARH
jgi:hypothetical protein